MYQINKSENNITRLEERLFSDLGFKERDNLQEWIADNPDILGEELLIIQKEFDGFNDTQERLDLLALDKHGNLVIIENKLDDTGRDVVWQALKYTSYCSTLKTSQVIKLYQDYLDRYVGDEQDSKSLILDFLGVDEETLLLNGGDQRLVLVANHFRKEVTSTVLWLLDHDIQIQCFKATPYSMGNELFLQVDQIIPQPEIEEYRINAKEKEKENKGKSEVVAQSERDLVQFWLSVKTLMKEKNIHHCDNITAKPYYEFGFTKGGIFFAMVVGRYAPRVEAYIANDADKKLFDSLKMHEEEIQNNFHGEITWERLDGKKASRIKFDMPKDLIAESGDWKNLDDRPFRAEWFTDEIVKFYDAIYPVWERVQK